MCHGRQDFFSAWKLSSSLKVHTVGWAKLVLYESEWRLDVRQNMCVGWRPHRRTQFFSCGCPEALRTVCAIPDDDHVKLQCISKRMVTSPHFLQFNLIWPTKENFTCLSAVSHAPLARASRSSQYNNPSVLAMGAKSL